MGNSFKIKPVNLLARASIVSAFQSVLSFTSLYRTVIWVTASSKRSCFSWKGRSPSYIMQHVSEDYYDHSPAGARSNKAAVEILKIVAQQFSDLKITVLDAFSQGNMVATRVLYEGVHTGECMGIAPTGKRICFEPQRCDHL